MKFNIIIANRDRDHQLRYCLRYLNRANEDRKHDICVYVTSEEPGLKGKSVDCFDGISVCHVTVSRDPSFRKGRVLNHSLSRMRPDFDYVMQFDSDLIANCKLFDMIGEEKADWHVLGGLKLTHDATSEMLALPYPNDRIWRLQVMPQSVWENNRQAYVGNICLTRECYRLYLRTFDQANLYNAFYVGWGGEDSELSITSTRMAQRGMITKYYHLDAWRHMWHDKYDERGDWDKAQYERNVKLLNNTILRNCEKIGSLPVGELR